MSSILKALQRLEQEKQDPDSLVRVRQGGGDSPVPGRLSRQKTIAFMLILIAVFMVSIYFAKDRVNSRFHRSEPRLTEPADHGGNSPDRMEPVETNSKPDASAATPLRFPDREQWVERIGMKEMNDAPASVLQSDSVESEKPSAHPGKNTPDNTPSFEKGASSLKISSPKDTVEHRDTPGLIPYQKNDITLQAIAWNETPEDRIAVVNGTVVREQDRVNGVLIHRINRDDLVIDKDGRHFILKMGK